MNFLADKELSKGELIMIDQLVQLLEAPVFSYMRIQLLVFGRNSFLVKSLLGILMLLPQSTAYKTLQNRLTTVFQCDRGSALVENTPSQYKKSSSMNKYTASNETELLHIFREFYPH